MSDPSAVQIAQLCLRSATGLGLLLAVIELWPTGLAARVRGRGPAPTGLLWGWRLAGCLYLATYLICPASIRTQVGAFWLWFGAAFIAIPGTRAGRRLSHLD